jgi:hypothetical protein
MDYQDSLERAITYIEENLGDVTVEEVAHDVGFLLSSYTSI